MLNFQYKFIIQGDEMEEIVQNRIYKIVIPQVNTKEPTVNIYYLKKENILIDAGPDNKAYFTVIESELKKFGKTIYELNAVILTHHHTDHIGMLKYFPSKTRVVGDKDINKFISDSGKYQLLNYLKMSELVQTQYFFDIKDKMMLEYSSLDDKFEIEDYRNVHLDNINFIKLSGHSTTDVCIEVKDLNVLFTGDLLLQGVYFNSIVEFDCNTKGFNTTLSSEYEKTLDVIKKSDYSLYFPAHGDSITDIKKIIDINYKRLSKNKRKFLKIMDHPMSVVEVTDRLFSTFIRFSMFLPFSYTYQLLQSMLQEGEIVYENGFYRVNENV